MSDPKTCTPPQAEQSPPSHLLQDWMENKIARLHGIRAGISDMRDRFESKDKNPEDDYATLGCYAAGMNQIDVLLGRIEKGLTALAEVI